MRVKPAIGFAAALLGLLCVSPLIAATPTSERTGPQGEPLLAPDAYRRVAPSVVSIVVSGRDGKPLKTGSGIVIDTMGHILTNYHVVEGGTFFDVASSGVKGKVKTISARPAACAPDQDLAELELSSPTQLHAVKKATGVPEIGSRVYAIGSPLTLEGTLTEGVVSQFRDFGERKLIQTTAAISPGSSGGGLFNSRGELVGITTLSISVGQSLNFAVSLAGLRPLAPCDEFPVLIAKEEPVEEPTPAPTPTPCPPKFRLRLGAPDFLETGREIAITGQATMRVRGVVTNEGCGSASFVQLRATVLIKNVNEYIASKTAFADSRTIAPGRSSDFEILVQFSSVWIFKAADAKVVPSASVEVVDFSTP